MPATPRMPSVPKSRAMGRPRYPRAQVDLGDPLPSVGACQHGRTMRNRRLGPFHAIALASLCLWLASCVGPEPSASRGPATGTSTLLTWAPPFATGGHVDRSTAVRQARGFQAIAAHPWTYRGDLAPMRRAHPGLTV